MDTHKADEMHAYTLKDGVFQVAFKVPWKKMEKIIKMLKKLVKL
jgi:hypothetical protein